MTKLYNLVSIFKIKLLNYPSLFIDYCVILYLTWKSELKVLVSYKQVKNIEDILFIFEPDTIYIP